MIKRLASAADTGEEMTSDLRAASASDDDLVHGKPLPADPLASDEDKARRLADAYRLPFVDLAVTGISAEAVKLIPLRVLERVVAIPYALEGDVLQVAVTDPENVHGIDELRLAARQTVEFA